MSCGELWHVNEDTVLIASIVIDSDMDVIILDV